MGICIGLLCFLCIIILCIQLNAEETPAQRKKKFKDTKQITTKKGKGKEDQGKSLNINEKKQDKLPKEAPTKPSKRAVIQMNEDGTEIKSFESIAEASRALGINSKSIRSAANGTQKHAAGYRWKYKESEVPKLDTQDKEEQMDIKIDINENGEVSIDYTEDSPKTLREYKGKSLLALKNDYVVIDLETTGLDPRFDEIIELGAIRYVNDTEAERFQSFAKPPMPISEFITSLTGITNDMVNDAPDISDILPKFREFVGDSIVLGHNVNFDINFIYDYSEYFRQPAFSNDFIDLLRISRRVHKDIPDHKLTTLCEYLGIPQPVEHRALADCIRTQACYVKTKSFIQEHNSSLVADWERYNSMSKRIVADSDKFDPDNILYGKGIAFTGTLQRMTRKEAMQAVADIGAICCDGVTKKTNYLVLGNNDYCKSIKDGKSAKQKKAEKLQLEGQDIQVLSEDVFYELIDNQVGNTTI